MQSTYRFLRRYPLMIAGILFLAGQLAVGIVIVICGWRPPQIAPVLFSGAAIFTFLGVCARRYQSILTAIFACLCGMISQYSSLPTTDPYAQPAGSFFIRGEFQVVSLPKRKATQKVTFTVSRLPQKERMRVSAVELPWRAVSGIRNNDTFKGVLKCRSLKKASSLFSFEYLLLRQGISASCQVLFAKPYWSAPRESTFIEKLRQALPELHELRLEYGLLLSLIFGIDSELPVQLEKSFKRTGMTHLLVFSGAQTSLIYFSLSLICRYFFSVMNRFRYRGYTGLIELLLSFIGTVAFCALIGFDNATMRAVIASGLVVFASIKETNQGMLYRMLLSLVVLAALWPGCFLEPGVQLTYGALLGIWWGLQFKTKIISYVQMSVAIAFLTNAVTFLWFGSVSIAGLILNPVIAPAVSIFSVYAGIPAVLLIYSNISVLQWFPRFVLLCLSYLESFVFWVSRFEWAYYNS